MTKITVHVTKEVIKMTSGCSIYDGENCAVAYAIRELFPKAVVFCLEMTFHRKDRHNRSKWAKLPQEVSNFITEFDTNPAHRHKLSPFSFDIEIPDEALEGIDISEVHRILKESKTLSLSETN